jgi:hypothetical protein
MREVLSAADNIRARDANWLKHVAIENRDGEVSTTTTPITIIKR